MNAPPRPGQPPPCCPGCDPAHRVQLLGRACQLAGRRLPRCFGSGSAPGQGPVPGRCRHPHVRQPDGGERDELRRRDVRAVPEPSQAILPGSTLLSPRHPRFVRTDARTDDRHPGRHRRLDDCWQTCLRPLLGRRRPDRHRDRLLVAAARTGGTGQRTQSADGAETARPRATTTDVAGIARAACPFGKRA
jgi:hypothetical protein